MEKQIKQFIGIIILLVLLVAAFFGIKAYNSAKEEEAEKEVAEIIQVVDLTISDITAFSYQLNSETMSFRRDGENWIYEQDETIDMDADDTETKVTEEASATEA